MKAIYLEHIRSMRDYGVERSTRLQREWAEKPTELRGLEPRNLPGAQAIIDAFLYGVTGEAPYAESAVELLAANDASLFDYVRAYWEVAESPAMRADQKVQIEERIAGMASSFLEHHVEWGAMNHATNYIVDGMTAAAQALPEHPRRPDWEQFAEKMLATSWGQWGIEDSHNYSPIWLKPMLNYADLTGRREFFAMPTTVYYFHYYLQLLCPVGSIPEFGDGGWGASWERYVPLLERGAAEYGNGEMKYAARVMFEAFKDLYRSFETGVYEDVNWAFMMAALLTDAYRWADDSIEECVPTTGSRQVLEDYVGKKVVFRNGWDSSSTYLLLNYMDVPAFGVDGRDLLRTTIPVEAEKTHHGQAEENSICLLTSKGSVLLAESGYRETDTTGPNGEFRADTYHNRLVVREGVADPQTRLLPFLLDAGQYRFVTTQSLHFHALRPVDVSRTRLIDEDRGYRWDRVVTYLKEADLFVLFDIVKVLTPGDYTFANLLYGQRLVETRPGLYQVRIDSLGHTANIANPDTASLAILYPDRDGKRDGAEQIRRCYENQVCVYQARADRFEAGEHVTFTTVLMPVQKDQDPESQAPRLEHVTSEDGALGVGLRLHGEDGYMQLCATLDPEAAYLEENVRPRYTFESGRSKYGDLETDARYVALRVAPGKVDYSFVEATKLVYAGKELFAPPTVPMRQDDGTYSRPGLVRWRAWEDEAEV